MPKHNNAKMAQSLYVSQREEAGCRAALIQAQETIKRLTSELEKIKFDRNYWRDRAETLANQRPTSFSVTIKQTHENS